MAQAAHACYCGLVVIPTTDMVGTHHYSIEYQVDGRLRGADADTHLINTQFGMGDRAEIGVDFDVSSGAETRLALNAKYLLYSSAQQQLAVAGGICSVGPNLKSNPYLVSSKAVGTGRCHLGVMHIDGRTQLIAGYDVPTSKQLTLMADITTGSGNESSVGLNYVVNEQFSVMAGSYLPNNGSSARFTVHFVYAAPWSE